MSGYEMATGDWADKFSPERIDEFWGGVSQQIQTDLNRSLARRGRRKDEKASIPGKLQDKQKQVTPPKVAEKFPLLWAIPITCFMLFVLSLFGLPRAPTVVVSALAGGYLAYFGITMEQAASNLAITGGIVQHRWLLGFWATCIGLLIPAVSALIKLGDP